MNSSGREILTSVEAAEQLGVSVRRVHALAASGALRSQRLGNRLVFDAGLVRQRAAGGSPNGRPYAPEVAWAVLSIASGREWVEEDASLRWRYRVRAANLAQPVAENRFARRASSEQFRAVGADIQMIRAEPDVVLGGVSAAREYGFDISAPDVVEAYVSRSGLRHLRERYWMEPADAASANLILRAVPDQVWRMLGGERFAPFAAAAIDLIESHDDRSRRAGFDAIERLGKT